jgi:hypothetical protein
MSELEKVTLYRPRGLAFWRPKVKYAEGCLAEGERHGQWLFWHANGQKQLEGAYIKGKKDGTWTKWNDRGSKISEGSFLYGKMNGLWTDWHGNGQKAQESHWQMGKRDGQWTLWNKQGDMEETSTFDHRLEKDRGYSIHTDLEAKDLVREIQRKALQHNWEGVVGRTVAGFVKPWHIACWLLLFIAAYSLIEAKTVWRSVGLAGITAFVITSLLAWTLDNKNNG